MRLTLALACVCLLTLAGCNADPNEEAVQCPQARLLPELKAALGVPPQQGGR